MARLKNTVAELRRALILVAVCLLMAGGTSPIINSGHASAAQITSRSVQISSALAGATAVSYTIGLVPGTSAAIQSIKLQACTTALGTCTAPTGLSFSSVGASSTNMTNWTTATAFTTGAGSNNCTASASIICGSRTAGTAESGATIRTATFTNLTNQNSTNCSSANNCTFFIRITTFSDTAYVTTVDTGTVASSTNTSVFTINAAIQEALTFCVGATTIDDSNTTTPPACSSVSGTSLNIGTLDFTKTNVSPVASGGSTNGDGNNAIAELSTNATNGASVNYYAVQAGSGTNHLGSLRVTGATCNAGNVNTDQCIDSQGTTQGTFTAGTEKFGMTIAAVNCKATTAYTCAFASANYHLVRDTNYDGTGANTYPTDTGQVSGTTNAGYAWDESGTADLIASSSAAVDREALIIKFAATPSSLTPAGSYLTKADYVATPIF